MALNIFTYDPDLLKYEDHIHQRMECYQNKRRELIARDGSLVDFANGHEYFGFHKTNEGWYYREWAPAAEEVYLTGDMVKWDKTKLKLTPLGNGVFEIFLPGRTALYDGCMVKVIVKHKGELLERIPLYIKRSVQNPKNYMFNGVIVDEPDYRWKHDKFVPSRELCVYECHIGMGQEKEAIGTYREFRENTLPRIKRLGYNAIQIMAIMEHPYYGSFGYQVSSFFASSFRFGTPNELKELIDAAHGMGIAVFLDLVHSHAVKNTLDGINEFDGTTEQFFHEGPRGEHPAWNTKLFNYGKNEVIHFLLSNLKFWMTNYRFDGFRFDGITSMLYLDHGLGVNFDGYHKYFSDNTDTEAITYLQLANELIHSLNPNAVTIAEDMSAMPGMCLPIEEGGIGFDYRLAMGQPDLWIGYAHQPEEEWKMWKIWHELAMRRPMEKSIGYVESHDQAIVGDKTLIFRLCDSHMYFNMHKDDKDPVVARGMAIHKIARMLTMSLGGEGYLNFMGNEFGHPEWIDFPRKENGLSYARCRRQWSLADNPDLKYQYLQRFDKEMLSVVKENHMFFGVPVKLELNEEKHIIMYERAGVVCVFNLDPVTMRSGYDVPVPAEGQYRVLISSDEYRFGGDGEVAMDHVYTAMRKKDGTVSLKIHLPARTGICLKRI